MERLPLAIAQSPIVRWFRDRPTMVDVILAVIVGAQATIVVLSFVEVDELSVVVRDLGSWWEWLLVVGPAWLIPFRRRFPVPAVLIGAPLQAAIWSMNFPDTYLAMAVLNYSAAAFGGTRGRWASWSTAAALTGWTALGVATGEAPAYAIPIVGFFSSAAVSLGIMTSSNRAHAEAAEAKADHLERTRASDRERTLVEERARIARELHDVVAHGLSVIVVQAGAARRIIDRDPAAADEALNQIEETGRNALNEMRHVLAAIRTAPEESWQPAPGLAALDDLIAELSVTGLTVIVNERSEVPDGAGAGTITTSGGGAPSTGAVIDHGHPHPQGHDHPQDHDAVAGDTRPTEPTSTMGAVAASTMRPTPATVDVTAYRIVQEALTNVLKHAGRGAKATVDIVRRARSLDLEIVDNGRGAKAADGGGHGLRGMQERVEVFGGRFSAGPRPGGGFAVSVSLPFDAPTDRSLNDGWDRVP